MSELSADFLAGYESGYFDGIDRGRRDVEDEWRGRMSVSAAVARHIAARPSYVELAERRGQRDRARRQQQILAERRVTA